MVTGDRAEVARGDRVARVVGIDSVAAGRDPADRLLLSLQAGAQRAVADRSR